MAGQLEESQFIPGNNTAAGLAGAIAKAWELYGSERWELSTDQTVFGQLHIFVWFSIFNLKSNNEFYLKVQSL